MAERGTVKWFDDKKGYGMIERDGGADAFVHHTSISGEGRKTLMQGDSVEFELENLKFDGKVQGRAIAGTVANSDGSSSGNFTLARVDPPMSPVSGP